VAVCPGFGEVLHWCILILYFSRRCCTIYNSITKRTTDIHRGTAKCSINLVQYKSAMQDNLTACRYTNENELVAAYCFKKFFDKFKVIKKYLQAKWLYFV
jgi:hypothetical protein